MNRAITTIILNLIAYTVCATDSAQFCTLPGLYMKVSKIL